MDLDQLNIRRMSQLKSLPWFRLDETANLALRENSGVPPVIDIHAHVGWSNGFAKPIDYTTRCAVNYFYDYEAAQDLLNEEKHPWENEKKRISVEMWQSFFVLGKSSATHTAANLLAEASRFNYVRTCLLPIEVPFGARHAVDTMTAARLDDRLIPFAAIHPRPWGTEKVRRLKRLLDQGAPALKFHPEFQFIAPDNPHAMNLFSWCESHNVPVLAHCGYTGAEPSWLRSKAEPDRFIPMLKSYPRLRVLLAHAGLSRWEATLDIARKFSSQVWVDISGQPVPVIREILNRLDRSRICYGSDWPFYPLCVAMARALVATQDRPDFWPDLFHNNATRFLGWPSL